MKAQDGFIYHRLTKDVAVIDDDDFAFDHNGYVPPAHALYLLKLNIRQTIFEHFIYRKGNGSKLKTKRISISANEWLLIQKHLGGSYQFKAKSRVRKLRYHQFNGGHTVVKLKIPVHMLLFTRLEPLHCFFGISANMYIYFSICLISFYVAIC